MQKRKQNGMLVTEIAQTNNMSRETFYCKLHQYNPGDFVKRHPASPFSKWTGGKRSLLKTLHQRLFDSYDPQRDRLYELF